jgi:hypothetical protein
VGEVREPIRITDLLRIAGRRILRVDRGDGIIKEGWFVGGLDGERGRDVGGLDGEENGAGPCQEHILISDTPELIDWVNRRQFMPGNTIFMKLCGTV